MRAMSPNFIQEQLSLAYVGSGIPRRLSVESSGRRRSWHRWDHRILQGWHQPSGLPAESYDAVRNPLRVLLAMTSVWKTITSWLKEDDLPRVLILLLMPDDDTQWLAQTVDELCLRRCAYWVDLMGKMPSSNVSTVRVFVPILNMFDQTGLQRMFSQLLA